MLSEGLGTGEQSLCLTVTGSVTGLLPKTSWTLWLCSRSFSEPSHKTVNSFPVLLYFSPHISEENFSKEVYLLEQQKGNKDYKICWDFIAFKAVWPCRVCGTEPSPILFPTWPSSALSHPAIATTWGRYQRHEWISLKVPEPKLSLALFSEADYLLGIKV